MITPISQKDIRWKNSFIGNTRLRIGRWGCTICSLCMALEKLRGYFVNPTDAAKYWQFNAKAEILWNKTEFKGMKFVWRGYSIEINRIKDYANFGDTAVIIEVNHNHWAYVDKVDGKQISIIDSLDGKYYEKLPTQYRVTGFVLLEKEGFVPDWMALAWQKAKNKELKENDSCTPLNMKKLQEVLFELNIIEDKDVEPTIGWLMVVFDKIKAKW